MKEPTRGPIFACLYPGLCDVARANGYALAIHGTLVSDMDLIAAPWTEEAIDAASLAAALREHIGACGYRDLLIRDNPVWADPDNVHHLDSLVAESDGGQEPVTKPHGRLAWNLYLYAGTKVDLSVMPRIDA